MSSTEEQDAAEWMDVGIAIMLGTLFGLIIVIFALVIRFDPEARRAPSHDLDGEP